jgi:hypothetical protein
MGSLAPFDGWADGQQCAGESKDFLYPNNRAATLWYHDHALDITAGNNIFGLAGQYIVSLLRRDGGCGAPFNLDSIPAGAEHPMLIGVRADVLPAMLAGSDWHVRAVDCDSGTPPACRQHCTKSCGTVVQHIHPAGAGNIPEITPVH